LDLDDYYRLFGLPFNLRCCFIGDLVADLFTADMEFNKLTQVLVAVGLFAGAYMADNIAAACRRFQKRPIYEPQRTLRV